MKCNYYLVVSLLLGTLTQGNRSFHHMLSKEEVYKYSVKKWHHYIRSFIHTTILSEIKHKLFNTKIVLFKAWTISGLFIIYSKQKLEPTSIQRNIHRASGNIFLKTKPGKSLNTLKCFGFRCLYTWQLNPNSNLSLVLNFHQLQYSTSAIDCVYGNFSISLINDSKHGISKNKEIFYICGSCSSFTVYPRSMGLLLLKLYVGIEVKYHLNVSFEVMDTMYITSYQLNYTSTLHTSLINVNDNYLLYIFRIQVKKNMYIEIKPDKSFTLIVFDGPGFESNVLKKALTTYKTTTFQCILQLLKTSLLTGFLNHTSQTLGISEHIKVIDSISLMLPHNSKHEVPFALTVDASHSSYINVSLLFMKYKSQFLTSSDCSFGGICIFKELNGVSNDYECVCTNYEPNLGLSRNIYSSGSSANLILYWYKEYSEIEVALNISKTMCKVIIIDPCAAEYFCNPCTWTHSKEFNCKLDIDCHLACDGGNSYISCQTYLNEITQFTNVKLQTNKNKMEDRVVTYFFSMPYETCFVLQLRKQFLSDSLSSQVNDIFICSMSLEPSPVRYGQTVFKFMITGQLDSETSSLGRISFRNENYNRTYCVYELKDNTTKCSHDSRLKHKINASKLEEKDF